MNLLSTHDTERIITVLGDPNVGDDRTNDELFSARLTPEQYDVAKKRLMLASTVLYTVFGVPSVFYGDEAGLQGHHDPFCRLPYPWGREDEDLLAHFTHLGQLRREHDAFATGEFRIFDHTDTAIVYERKCDSESILIVANGGKEPYTLTLPALRQYTLIPFPQESSATLRRDTLSVPATQAVILCRSER